MAKRLNDSIDVKLAVANSVTSTTIVATKIDTTGFGRARFIFTLGGVAGIGAVGTDGPKIWKASTSGGTYTSIASAVLGAITSGAISAGGAVAVIDVPTDAANPWLQVSGALTSSNMYHSAVVELYGGINRPPTSSANQIVTV
jgi:hypothetical protein